MIVYRVQNANGRGPYSAISHEGLPDWHVRDLARHNAKPRAHLDGQIWVHQLGMPDHEWEQYRTGTVRREQLRDWFDWRDCKFLQAHGFDLVTIDAHLVVIGNHQCVFRVDQSRVVDTASPVTLYL